MNRRMKLFKHIIKMIFDSAASVIVPWYKRKNYIWVSFIHRLSLKTACQYACRICVICARSR